MQVSKQNLGKVQFFIDKVFLILHEIMLWKKKNQIVWKEK